MSNPFRDQEKFMKSCDQTVDEYNAEQYALLSQVDNNIQIDDWNIRYFNLGSRFYQNFHIHAKKNCSEDF